MVHDIEVGKSELSQTQEDLAAVKEKLTSYYEERHRLETENQELKQKRHQISEQISSDQQTLVDVTRLISDFERQIDLYTMESQQRSEKKEETEARLSELEHLKAEASASQDKDNRPDRSQHDPGLPEKNNRIHKFRRRKGQNLYRHRNW